MSEEKYLLFPPAEIGSTLIPIPVVRLEQNYSVISVSYLNRQVTSSVDLYSAIIKDEKVTNTTIEEEKEDEGEESSDNNSQISEECMFEMDPDTSTLGLDSNVNS